MNKKLLALAVGAVFALPVVASAQPTLYGKVNVSLENDDDGTDDQWNVVSNASRIGVKGEVDTDKDGLKGIYKAEFGIAADDGEAQVTTDDPSAFSQRDIYVGLQGGFGTVMAGNMDTPTKVMQGKVDQFNDTSVDMGNHVAGELRAPNIVAYASPKIADTVTVTVALWQGEGADDDEGDVHTGIGDAISASVVYDNEGLYLGLGMDMGTPITGGAAEALSVDGYNDIVRLVAGYTTDTVEAGLLYQTTEGASDSSDGYEDTSMVLSGAYKTGAWKFKAQYGMTEVDDADVEITMLGLGADYALGKSTTAYAFYATEEVDDGDERTVMSVGLEQKF